MSAQPLPSSTRSSLRNEVMRRHLPSPVLVRLHTAVPFTKSLPFVPCRLVRRIRAAVRRPALTGPECSALAPGHITEGLGSALHSVQRSRRAASTSRPLGRLQGLRDQPVGAVPDRLLAGVRQRVHRHVICAEARRRSNDPAVDSSGGEAKCRRRWSSSSAPVLPTLVSRSPTKR